MIEEQPSSASLIADKQNEIIDHWEELMEKADQRKQKLEESRQFQRFLCDHRDLVRMYINNIHGFWKTYLLGTSKPWRKLD